MSNKEIVKAVLRETTLFNGAASVSKYSSECEDKMVLVASVNVHTTKSQTS